MEMIAGEAALIAAINDLLEQKRHSPELGLSPQMPVIHAFIEQELTRIENNAPEPAERQEIAPELSKLFRQVLNEAWA